MVVIRSAPKGCEQREHNDAGHAREASLGERPDADDRYNEHDEACLACSGHAVGEQAWYQQRPDDEKCREVSKRQKCCGRCEKYRHPTNNISCGARATATPPATAASAAPDTTMARVSRPLRRTRIPRSLEAPLFASSSHIATVVAAQTATTHAAAASGGMSVSTRTTEVATVAARTIAAFDHGPSLRTGAPIARGRRPARPRSRRWRSSRPPRHRSGRKEDRAPGPSPAGALIGHTDDHRRPIPPGGEQGLTDDEHDAFRHEARERDQQDLADVEGVVVGEIAVLEDHLDE